MKARLKRALVTLAIVFIGYQLYSLAANALISPPITFADPPGGPALSPRSVHSFEGLFPAGSWELGRPKVVETDQGTLLFDEYHTDSDGRIKLDRCTLIFNVHSMAAASRSDDDTTFHARPLVMRAESGATIEFDEPLSLMSGRLGRVVGGRLVGEIKIFRAPSGPGAEDALEVTTQGIQIDQQRIWTPHAVTFRYGPNRGSGRVLSIALQQKKAKDDSAEQSPAAGQIKSLELIHLDHLELHAVGDMFASLGSRSRQSVDRSGASADRTDRTVEIRCRGPVRFDFERNVATLSEQVDVIRHNLVGPSDQVNCEEMEIHFQRLARAASENSGQASAKDQLSPSAGLRTKKIVARGFPVIVRAPSQGATMRAEKMEYEFGRRRFWLKDRRQLTLHTSTFHVVAPELEYELPLEGQIGRLWAAGPGSLQKQDHAEGKQLTVEWKRELRIVRQDQSHVLSVQGAKITAPAATMTGDKVHVYLREQSAAGQPGTRGIVVERLQASGQVHVDSARISGAVSEAKIWFVDAVKEQSRSMSGTTRSALLPPPTSSRTESAAQFELAGEVLHAQVEIGEVPQLRRLSVEGGVHLTERLPGNALPTALSGDRLDVTDGRADQLAGELIGQPATVTARGASLSAPRFMFDQRDNRLQLFGPGTMVLPTSEQEAPTTAPGPPMRVNWTGGLTFDGSRVRFDQNVSVEGSYYSEKGGVHRLSVSSELLHVALIGRVDFKAPPEHNEVDVREFRFPGWVFLENQEFDRAGTRQSHDQMRVRDLVVDKMSGRIHGVGPGWIVHRGWDSGPDRQALFSGSMGPPGLAYLRVDFEREMIGNHHRREITFSDRVVCVYGPISSWQEALDVKSAQELGERDVLLSCQQLTVASMAPAGGSLAALEVQAAGNASVVGQTFSGRGQRISYSRKKDQLILTGDGRSDAYLKYQQARGAKPAVGYAARVEFYLGTKDFKLHQIRSFEAHAPAQFRDARSNVRQPGLLRRGYSQ